MAYRRQRFQQSPIAADHCILPSSPPPRRRTPEHYVVTPVRHWKRTIHIERAKVNDTYGRHRDCESKLRNDGKTP